MARHYSTKEFSLPKDVVTVKDWLSLNSSHDLCEIATKLMVNSPKLVAMWRTLERKNGKEKNYLLLERKDLWNHTKQDL